MWYSTLKVAVAPLTELASLTVIAPGANIAIWIGLVKDLVEAQFRRLLLLVALGLRACLISVGVLRLATASSLP